MRKHSRVILPAVILALVCASCHPNADEPAASTDTVILTTGDGKTVEVTVELAATPEQRARGLMYRKQLDPLHGMLFIFDDERQQAFWMKNTLIELDMIFIRSNMRVLGCVDQAVPQTTAPRRVQGASRYVLEVVGGFCRKYGITESSRAQFVLPSINLNK